jgi:glucose/arabinose dehydrogenase
MLALAWHDGKLYAVMNNRDQLDVFWPEHFTAQDNAERPAESMYRVDKQDQNFGWPYCFFDYKQQKLVLNPEYGGDGKQVGRCSEMTPPIVGFPAHWAPVDVMFYTGNQFPAKYKNGDPVFFNRTNKVVGQLDPRLGLFSIVDVCCAGIPADNLALFVF